MYASGRTQEQTWASALSKRMWTVEGLATYSICLSYNIGSDRCCMISDLLEESCNLPSGEMRASRSRTVVFTLQSDTEIILTCSGPRFSDFQVVGNFSCVLSDCSCGQSMGGSSASQPPYLHTRVVRSPSLRKLFDNFIARPSSTSFSKHSVSSDV